MAELLDFCLAIAAEHKGKPCPDCEGAGGTFWNNGKRDETCGICHGSGLAPPVETCKACGGDGVYECDTGGNIIQSKCQACQKGIKASILKNPLASTDAAPLG